MPPAWSQSLLFRSVFPLSRRPRNIRRCRMVAIPSIQVGFSIERYYADNEDRSGGAVAIPSIQVGFSIRQCVQLRRRKGDWSQSLLFRSVFPFCSQTLNSASTLMSRNPFYSGRFFHWGRNFATHVQDCICRNPFYSGRFFHLRVMKIEVVGLSEPSQSLLFRSVFPLVALSRIRIAHRIVAIPSIQVGFSIEKNPKLLNAMIAESRNPFYSGRFFH